MVDNSLFGLVCSDRLQENAGLCCWMLLLGLPRRLTVIGLGSMMRERHEIYQLGCDIYTTLYNCSQPKSIVYTNKAQGVIQEL